MPLLALCLVALAPSGPGESAQEATAPMVCSERNQPLGLQDPKSSHWGAAEARYARGEQFESMGDLRNAEDEFKAAIAQAPRADKYVRKLVLLEIERQQFDDAISAIREYVNLCGPTALGWALESELLFKQKLFDAAYEAAQNSLRLSNDNARMHEMLGLVYITKRQNAAAAIELGKAAGLDPRQPQIRYFYGRTLYSTGRFREAQEQFQTCLEIQPQYPRALENLGLCYEALRNFPRAFECYRKAMALEDAKKGRRNAEPYAFCGRLLLQQGSTEESLAVLRRAVGVSPRSFVANFELGSALLATGDLKGAEQSLLTARTLDPQYARTYYLLGRICKKQERQDEAAKYWATFERLNQNAENREIPLTD